MTKLLRPGYEILYLTGVPHADVKADFSKLYGVPLEHVIIREDGGGIFCRDGRDDAQEGRTGDHVDVSNDGVGGELHLAGSPRVDEVNDG